MFKVLIADDERLERESLKVMIKDIGNVFQVKEAINGKEAIEIYRQFRPDIVLLDIKMPVLSGIEVAEIIKKEDKSKYIVIITAYDDFEKVKNALVLGVDNYLLKPINKEEFKEVLCKYTNDFNINIGKEIDEFSCIRPGIEYIQEHYKENINLEKVASICALSPSYFSRTFKKEVGFNFITYLNVLKIDKAKEMLMNTKNTINNISLELGFNNCGYFIKIFKKITGITPKLYREQINKKI